ncbi:MAG: hypothetical protein JW781_10385 [Deltaproteobacteria bacterium]|nr:hypothetical protein [Candidatus Anaeroferrophillacea bacterium]
MIISVPVRTAASHVAQIIGRLPAARLAEIKDQKKQPIFSRGTFLLFQGKILSAATAAGAEPESRREIHQWAGRFTDSRLRMATFKTDIVAGRQIEDTPFVFLTVVPARTVFGAMSSWHYILGLVAIIGLFLISSLFLISFRNQKENITNLMRTEDELRAAKEAAEAANRAKSDFLAAMSHELRTPLNHIIGFTELVVRTGSENLTTEQAEYLQDVLNSSRHLLSLINDILDLSKIEAGRMELHPEHIEAAEVLQHSLNMIREKAKRHRLKLDFLPPPAPAYLVADARKIKQILFNLLGNAAKFTPDGGSIRLAAAWEDDPAAPRSPADADNGTADPGRQLHILVQDSGIDIAPEDLQKIFSTFAQVDSSASRRYQGTGLGLSLSRHMVELHGGRIWAESAGLGKGSTFHVVLPESPADTGRGQRG